MLIRKNDTTSCYPYNDNWTWTYPVNTQSTTIYRNREINVSVEDALDLRKLAKKHPAVQNLLEAIGADLKVIIDFDKED